MQKLNFDLGIKEFEIGGGVLRFNPSDPNVYARFLKMSDKLVEAEQRLVEKAQKYEGKNVGKDMLRVVEDVDREMKDMLSWVFGPQNDFEAIFRGTNITGVGENGERIITNFIHAVQPILEKGARNCAKNQVNQAKMNRAQRRAAAKKR